MPPINKIKSKQQSVSYDNNKIACINSFNHLFCLQMNVMNELIEIGTHKNVLCWGMINFSQCFK